MAHSIVAQRVEQPFVLDRIYGQKCSVFVPKNARLSGAYADQLAFVANSFLNKTAVSNARREGEGIPFHTRNWDRITRAKCDGKSLRQLSLDSGILEIENHRFIPRERSITYRLPGELRTGEFREHVIEKQVVKRWLTRTDDEPLDDVAKSLTALFPLFGVDASSIELTNWDQLTLARLNRQEFYSTRCDAGRFYSTFSGMAKKLRKHLISNASAFPLCSVDVSCCQPAIWSSLPFLSSPSSSLLSVPPPETKEARKRNSSYLLCAQVFRSASRQASDVQEWSELCSTADLYQRLIELTGIDASDPKAARDECKRALCVALYGDPKTVACLPMSRALRRHFSTIWHHSLALRKDDYRDASRLMRSIESALMIDGAAAAYMKLFPGEPILTVHDDMIVPADKEPAIRSLILKHFARLEIVPHIKPPVVLNANC